MAPGLDGEVERVLQSLGRLYGAGNPAASQAAVLARTIAEDMHSALNGGLSSGYSDARQSHTAVLDRHHERDGVTHGAVAKTGDGTVLGRNVINDQLAEYRSRLQALATVATSRFSGPAMLTSAHTIINNVVRQVNADSESTRRHAAQITMTAGAVRRRGSAGRVRGRFTTASARGRRRRGRRIRSDGTKGSNAVSFASGFLGTPYVWGGGGSGGPSGGGFDCSGLTQYAIAKASGGEVILPRTTYDQIHSGMRVPVSEARAGDLVFPGSSFSHRGPEHVQLCAGNGMVIEAPYSGSHVKWSRMSSNAVIIRVL